MILALLSAAPVLFGASSFLFTYINNEDCDTKSDDDCDKLEYFDFSRTWPAACAGLMVGEVVLAFVVSAYRFFNGSTPGENNGLKDALMTLEVGSDQLSARYY